MANVMFDNPPIRTGTPEDQLKAIYDFLFTQSQKLTEAMNSIELTQLEPETQTAIRQAGEAEAKAEASRKSSKELIIKNAEQVRTEIDRIVTELNQSITAISESFGTYQQNIHNEIEQTAAGIRQTYEMLETIVNTANTANEEYRRRLSSFIYSGILDSTADPPVTGIAIGQNVTKNDGTLNDENKMATFTADRITFYLNGIETGYYEGNMFHISRGEVVDSMKMGNFVFKVFAGGSMGLMVE